MLGEDETATTTNEAKYPATLVTFKFGKKLVESRSYVGEKITADGLDRLVIWPLEGSPTVMTGQVKIITGIEGIEFQADNVTVPPQSK